VSAERELTLSAGEEKTVSVPEIVARLEGAGTLKVVSYTVRRLSLGDIHEDNVAGLYDGPFPWENTFGFHLAGMVGHEFFQALRGNL
jgi:hypothetical protein